MNRQPSREDIQRYLQRWQQLKAQYGNHAVNVPEFNQLTKIIRYIQAQAMLRQQGGSAGGMYGSAQQNAPPQNQPPQNAPPAMQTMAQKPYMPMGMRMGSSMQGGNNMGANAANMGGMGAGSPGAPPTPVAPPAASPAVAQMGMMGMMNMQPSPAPQQQLPPPGAPPGGFPVQGGPYVGDGPFTPQQMLLLKLQTQAAKFLFKSQAGAFPPPPVAMMDAATNERMAVADAPTPAAALPPQTAQSPQFGFQRASVLGPGGAAGTPTQTPLAGPAMGFAGGAAVPGQITGQMGQMGQMSPMGQMSQIPGQIAGQIPNQMGQMNQMSPAAPTQTAKRGSRGRSGAGTPSSSDPNAVAPVARRPAVPREFADFTRGMDLSNELVVPVSDPTAQVDTFVVPRVMTGSEDVPFGALYTRESRVRVPAVMPVGVSVDEVMGTREAALALAADARASQVRARLEELGPAAAGDLGRAVLGDDTILSGEAQRSIEMPQSNANLALSGALVPSTRGDANEPQKALQPDVLAIEAAALELLPEQRTLRGHVLSHMWFSKLLLPNSHPNFLAIFAELSLDNVVMTEELYKQQLYLLVQAQNRKHQDVVARILSFTGAARERRGARRERRDRLGIKINSFHAQTAKEEQKKLERMAKQRLQALKLNDEEAYLKLLDHTKDTRITHLLSQTNQFLDTLAQAVQTQQRESHSYDAPPEEKPMDDEKREKVDYYQVAHRIKEEVTAQPHMLVGGTLKEYQLKGLQWMVSLFNNHLNGILADEMGLGKTIQTISLLTYLVEKKNIPGPFLVIVPLLTLTNWNLEFEKWAPGLKKITYKGTPVQRKVMQHDIRLQNFQVLLTTFEYVIKDRSLLSKIKWVHMIIDEGHRMKNANSKLSETLTQFYHTDYRLILTGTPLQNNLPELWALLNFVLPKIFNSVKSFDEWFNTPFANTGGQDKIELSEEETLLVIRRLHKVLRPFLLRRLKKDVEKDLPNKIEKVIKCSMSSLQSKLYRMMLKYNALFAGDTSMGKKASTIKNANNQLMQLRKICNHPFVYEEVENLINPKVETNDTIWRVAGKFELLDRILPKFQKTGHRVLIFFQMTQIMDIMEDFLRLRGMKYMRLDGGTKSDDRTELLKLFNAPGSDYFCFLLSTRAGGLGLNLQTADTVIIFDSDWNPHQDLQAQDRAHRIGQKNEVRILRLITEDSIEEMILERAVAKLEIDGKVIQAGKFDNKSTSEEQEALLRALMDKEEERRLKGADEEDDLDDDELNQIIARNDQELVTFKELDTERAIETRNAPYSSRLYTDQELPEIYQTDPQQFYKSEEQLIEEYGRGNRERKTAVYDDNLTEEEWLKKIEGIVSDDSDTDGTGRRKGRNRRKDEDLRKRFLDDEDSSSKRARSSTPGLRPKGRPRSNKNKIKTSSNRSTPTVDALSPEDRMRLQNTMDIIYGNVLDYKESDRKLSDLFLVKPSKRLYPDYYVLIKHPLALDMVKKRINNKTYSNIREYLEDIHLIFSNARIYNEEGSIVYQDARTLENLAFNNYKELCPEGGEEEWQKTLDFTEFDKVHQLKPLAVGGSAIKQPVAVAVPVDMNLNVISAEDTVELTPFFDLKDLPSEFL